MDKTQCQFNTLTNQCVRHKNTDNWSIGSIDFDVKLRNIFRKRLNLSNHY